MAISIKILYKIAINEIINLGSVGFTYRQIDDIEVLGTRGKSGTCQVNSNPFMKGVKNPYDYKKMGSNRLH